MKKVLVWLAALLSVSVEVVLAFAVTDLLQAWFGQGVAVVFGIVIVLAVGVLLTFGTMGLHWFMAGVADKAENR